MKLSGKQRAVFCFEVVTIVAAIALVATGSWIHSAGSEWLVFTGIALFLLAGVPVLRALAGPWTTEDLPFDRKSSAKRISHGIVALSSAAILSVYAAGFPPRTSSAADRFETQNALERHRNAAIAAAVALPSAQPAQSPAAEARGPIAIASVKPDAGQGRFFSYRWDECTSGRKCRSRRQPRQQNLQRHDRNFRLTLPRLRFLNKSSSRSLPFRFRNRRSPSTWMGPISHGEVAATELCK